MIVKGEDIDQEKHLPRRECFEEDDASADINLVPLVECSCYKIPCRKPRLAVVVESPEELFASELGRLGKLSLYMQGL